MRKAQLCRTTRETDIALSLCLDGGEISISTGVGFFDHMLTALAVHAGFGLVLTCKGGLEVDCHHTIEDVGIVLGQAMAQAADRAGIARYGSAMIPMDEALALCALDVSGRPYLVFDCEFSGDRIGEMDTQMVEEFFRTFAFNAGITLHCRIFSGKNDHHKAEALFKALAHALSAALKETGGVALSTKGVL